VALTVVKVGGSIANQPVKLRELLKVLYDQSKKYPLLIIPGGGEFADTVRKQDKQFTLSAQASHRMAILAMDQYGIMLADLIPAACIVRSIDEVKKTLIIGNLPVFLPSKLLFREDPLENSWDVTSDSITLYLAQRLNAGKVLFLTDVDGIFSENPQGSEPQKLLKKISAAQLIEIGDRTSVDKALPKLLQRWPIPCYVVNGFYPRRVEALLNQKEAPSTIITV
jgi:5-(aminomethyl)-3-furanmethanol phosphate kinase